MTSATATLESAMLTEAFIIPDNEESSSMGNYVTRTSSNAKTIINGKERIEDTRTEEKAVLNIAQVVDVEEQTEGIYYTFDTRKCDKVGLKDDSGEEKPELEEIDQTSSSDVLPKNLIMINIWVVVFVVLTCIGFAVFDNARDKGDDTSTLSPTSRLILGVLNALVGSLLTASGYCCQKWAHNQALVHVQLRPATKQPIFISGLVLLFAGTISTLGNLGLLGQAVQAPLTGLTLIYNAVLAKFILKEEYSRRDLYSSVMIIGGVAISVFGAGLSEVATTTYDLDKLIHLFVHESMLPPLYTVLVILAIICVNMIIQEKKLQATGFGLFGFSFSAGAMAGFTSLTAKAVVEISKSVVERDTRDELRPMTYVFVLLIPISLLLQLMYMNRGLKYFGTLKFVPLYQSFIILANMACGDVYFKEMAQYTIPSDILFLTGCCITVFGMWVSF